VAYDDEIQKSTLSLLYFTYLISSVKIVSHIGVVNVDGHRLA